MGYCRAAEAANSQLTEISSHGPDTVNYLSKSKKVKSQSQPQLQAQRKTRKKYCLASQQAE